MTAWLKNMHETLHFRSPAAGKLKDILSQQLQEAQTKALDLITFGAVYVEKVREVNPDTEVPADSYIRVHTRPRRFPVADKIDWRKRLIHACQDFVILNKPGGLPVHASLDNVMENCVVAASREVGAPLYSLHRLDVPTHGILVLGRSSEFNTFFCSMLRNRLIRKEYLALVYRPPPLGLMVHYMKPSARSPKIVEREPQPENWQECKLIVKHVEAFPHSLLSPRALQVISSQANSDGQTKDDDTPNPQVFEVRIELLTGRTHQIRAQLSKEGCDLVGDEMYRNGTVCLSAQSLDDADDQGDDNNNEDAPSSDSAAKDAAREMEIEGTLALQAALIEFPRLLRDSNGRPINLQQKAKVEKKSKRQRREERLREAEETLQRAAKAPEHHFPSTAGEATCDTACAAAPSSADPHHHPFREHPAAESKDCVSVDNVEITATGSPRGGAGALTANGSGSGEDGGGLQSGDGRVGADGGAAAAVGGGGGGGAPVELLRYEVREAWWSLRSVQDGL